MLSSPVFSGTEPVSPDALLLSLDDAYRATRVASHRGPVISQSNASKRLSYLRRTLAHESLVGLADVRAVLVDLPGLAQRVHRDAAGAVRLTLRDAFGLRSTHRLQLRHGISLFPETLRDLASLRLPSEQDSAGVLGQLLRVAVFCGDADAPRTMPKALEIREAASRLVPPVAQGSINVALYTYRKLRA